MSKLKEEILDEINKAIVAFKIGKITELEKDIAIKAQLDLYAKEKLKEAQNQIINEVITFIKTSKDPFMFPLTEERFIDGITKHLNNANNK